MSSAQSRLLWLVSTDEPNARFGPFDLQAGAGRHAGRVLLGCGPGVAPTGNLRINERGNIAPNGANGKWAQFYLLPELVAQAAAEACRSSDAGMSHPLFSETVTLANFGNADKVRETPSCHNCAHALGPPPTDSSFSRDGHTLESWQRGTSSGRAHSHLTATCVQPRQTTPNHVTPLTHTHAHALGMVSGIE
jgi:hypothetical protein